MKRIVAKPSYRGRSPEPPCVTVLCYHRVLERVPSCDPEALFYRRGMAVSAATLRSQLRQALRQFEPVSATQLAEAWQGRLALPENALLVTFDDGYRDFAELALPILRQMGVPPVVFARQPNADGLPSWAPLDLLYTGRGLAGMETPLPSGEWRTRLLSLPLGEQLDTVAQAMGDVLVDDIEAAREDLYLADSELRNLVRAGVAIGAHGEEHELWTELPPDELRRVLNRSTAWLADIGGQPILAYPDGAVNPAVASHVQARGFTCAYALKAVPEGVPARLGIRRVIVPDDPKFVATLISGNEELAG